MVSPATKRAQRLALLLSGLDQWGQAWSLACGAGAMMIAMTQALAAQGIEYQTKVHVTADDISAIAVHMSYVQLSLLGVPALVNRRNSLTLEHFDTWPTPAHVLGGWAYRLALADR